MKRTIFFFAFFLFLTFGTNFCFAESPPQWARTSGWKDIGRLADILEVSVDQFYGLTDNKTLVYWAGEAVEFYWNATDMAPGKLKIRVTWTSDRGVQQGFTCGKKIVRSINEIKDFTNRSLKMYQCN